MNFTMTVQCLIAKTALIMLTHSHKVPMCECSTIPSAILTLKLNRSSVTFSNGVPYRGLRRRPVKSQEKNAALRHANLYSK